MTAESSFYRTQLGIATIIALLCLGIGLRLANVSNVSLSDRSPDERVYTRLANTFLQQGNAGVRFLVEEYQRDPSVRVTYPPVTRIGYLWLLAATMRITGKTDENAGAYLSCAVSIGSLFILTLIGIRFFPPGAALAALLFFAAFPPELALARRTWGDALVGFLALALVWSAAEIIRDSRPRIWYLLFIVTGTLGLVVKESWPVVYGLCAVWLLWILLVQRREWKNGLSLILGGLAGITVSVAWLANSAGGLWVVVEVLNNWFSAVGASAYTLEYQSGPGYLLLKAFWILSPAPAALWLIGLAVVLSSRPGLNFLRVPTDAANWRGIGWIALFMLSYLCLPMILPYWLNLRYMSVIYGPFCLLAGLGFWYCASVCLNRLEGLNRKSFAAVAIGLVAVVGLTEYQRFHRIFVQEALPDLSIRMLLDADQPIGQASANRRVAQNPVSVADLADAEAQVKRAPTPEGYLNLSLHYNRVGRYRDSIAAAAEALKLRPNYAEAYNNIAAAYNELAMWDEAIRAEQEALRIKPDFQLARNNLAWSLSQRKRAVDELAAAEAGAKRVPTPENYLNLSLQYYRNGRYQDSIAACREALKLKPDYAEAHNNIAAAYQAMGLWDDAIQAAQRAVTLKPDFQLARNNLEYSLNQKRLKDAAKK